MIPSEFETLIELGYGVLNNGISHARYGGCVWHYVNQTCEIIVYEKGLVYLEIGTDPVSVGFPEIVRFEPKLTMDLLCEAQRASLRVTVPLVIYAPHSLQITLPLAIYSIALRGLRLLCGK